MAYTNLTNLKKYMPIQDIQQLTDDQGIGEIQTEVVDDAIDQAQQLIDSFMKGRYPDDIPDDEVPELITDIATKITSYNLYRRTMIRTLPDPIKMDYQMCIKMLKGIQSGKISPFPADDEPTIFVTNKTDSDRIYTSNVWSQY